MISAEMLARQTFLRELTDEERTAILNAMTRRDVPRGQRLVVEGEPSNALYLVLHGSFDVRRGDACAPIAQIRAGEFVGEIGLFARTPRTATVVATRDATVLELDRAAYERMGAEMPNVMTSLLAALARRLAETSARLPARHEPASDRTVTIIHGGAETIPAEFFVRMRNALRAAGARVVNRDAMVERFGDVSPDCPEVGRWLDDLEWKEQLLVYVADERLTDWTRKCIRQADQVVVVTRGHTAPPELNPVEQLACETHGSAARRLVRVHDRRIGVVSGTSAWLRRMDVHLHHHVALEDDVDFESVARFLTGRAVGFAAGGGGAFGPAHSGIYKAFQESGVVFDVFIGTSVGAAITAGFAQLHPGERLEEGTEDIFVRSRSFKRPTFPRFALLDHKAFDEALARQYGKDVLIEDCWRPFFAVATNLSTQRLELIRTGLLWQAVRASSAIPVVLPPFYTKDGQMLVDGGVMDNAPLAPLKEIKTGPNVVVHFGKNGMERFDCRYEDLPGRWELIASMLNPFARKRAPRAPTAINVLLRSLMAHQRYDLPAEKHDLVLRPPKFPGASFMDFDQHAKVFISAHQWTLGTMRELAGSGNEALAAVMASARPVEPSVRERPVATRQSSSLLAVSCSLTAPAVS